MERTKLARPARLNNSILVKPADVADDVFHHQDKNKEIKWKIAGEREGGRPTELRRVVGPIPNTPAHIKPRINAVACLL